jgi:hypothetical protein
LGGRMYQTNIEGSAAPALTAGQNSLSNTNVDFFKSPLIDGTKGDVGYLTQLVTSSLPETTQANVVTRFFQAPSYTAIDGGNPTVSGAFTNVTLNKTLAVNWRRSQFAALKSAVSTASNNCTQLFNVSAVPNGNSGLAPDLLNIGVTGPQVSTDLAVNLQYGNPYPATWTEYATAELICNVGLTAGTTSLQVSAAVYVNGPIASVSAHDVVPLISPPRNLKIAGMDGTGNLTGIGTTPVVSWDPPAMGGPISGYGIYFYSNTGTLNVPVAALFVDGATTSVTVPPVMAVGTPYAIVVESNYSQGSVSGWADLVSGIVTP